MIFISYENGNKIENYIDECLDKYKLDNNIFNKTIKMIELYMKRTDWPNCIEELELKAEKILGVSIITLTFGVAKYINDDNIDWSTAGDDFKSDYSYFYDTIGELYNMYWMGRFEPNGFYGISYSIGIDNIYNLRISRKDSKYIDFRMDLNDLRVLRDRINDVIEQGENNGGN